MSLFLINIQSLRGKLDDIYLLLESQNFPNFLLLTEHWLEPSEPFSIQDYKLISLFCRNSHIHGGAAILINADFSRSFEVVSVTKFDYLIIENGFEFSLAFNERNNLYILCIYRPPYHTNLSEFFVNFEELLIKLPCKANLILGGDLNINFDDEHSEVTRKLYNLFLSFNLEMYVNEPTRVTTHSQTKIDYVCSNFSPKGVFVDCTVIPVGISDHNAVMADFELVVNRPPKTKIGRLFSKKNYQNFTNVCSSLSWLSVLNAESPFDDFHRQITNTFVKCFPLQKIKKKNKKSWITRGIRVSSGNFRSLQMIRKFTDNPLFLVYFNKYKSIYRNLIEIAKQKFYQKKLKSSSNITRENWKIINELTGKNSRVTSKTDLNPNDLNDFYCTIAQKLQQDLECHVDPISYLSNAMIDDTFVLETTNMGEVLDSLNEIKNKKSSGYDDMSGNLLKALPDSALYVLAECINISFLTGSFPRCLKRAVVIPLHKGGELDEPSNYRPISLLSTFSKIVEKLVKKRMLNYFDKHHILSSTQFGFLPSKSTNDAMFNVFEQIYTGLNEGEVVATVFCDFSKAFDCVNHSIMLKKLEIYGFRGVAHMWFESYFNDREQIVRVGNNESLALPLKNGVPQGSVLGPILFLLYLNDINNLPIRAKLTSFADDITLSWRGKNVVHLKTIIAEDLTIVKKWCDSNLLCFNSKKTNILTFKFEFNDLILGTHPIENRTNYRVLGVNIDSQLKFTGHVTNLNRKLASGCYAVRIIVNELGFDTAKLVYYSMVESHIRYGISFWGNCSDGLFESVFVLQKRAIRYLCKAKYRQHCKPFFIQHRILTVSSMFILETACLMHKYHYMSLNNFRSYSTRQQLQIRTPIPRSAMTHNSIVFRSKQIFNHLPLRLREIDSLRKFRLEVKGLLCRKAYYRIDEFLSETF